jgi:hypothetical protein
MESFNLSIQFRCFDNVLFIVFFCYHLQLASSSLFCRCCCRPLSTPVYSNHNLVLVFFFFSLRSVRFLFFFSISIANWTWCACMFMSQLHNEQEETTTTANWFSETHTHAFDRKQNNKKQTRLSIRTRSLTFRVIHVLFIVTHVFLLVDAITNVYVYVSCR